MAFVPHGLGEQGLGFDMTTNLWNIENGSDAVYKVKTDHDRDRSATSTH